MSSHVLSEGLTEPDTLHWAHWQAVAFWLPLGSTGGLRMVGCPTQILWTPPSKVPYPHWCLWPKGFLGCETGEHLGLSLGMAGPHWRVRFPHRSFLCVIVGTTKVYGSPDDPQQWWNSWAFLLRPTGEEHRTSPTPDEEAALLGEVDILQVPEQLEVHELVHPAEWIATHAAPPHPLLPNQVTSLLRRQKKSQQGIKVNTTSAGQWVSAYLEENNRASEWWREF